jgi:hypothetical protein
VVARVVQERTEGKTAYAIARDLNADAVTGRLHVFDYLTGKRYETSPRKAHRKTDYFRFDEPGVDPNLMERKLSRLESAHAQSVRQVGSGEIADRRAIAQVLELAATLRVRSTTARMDIGKAVAAHIATKLRNGEVSREEWEHLRESELRNGATPDEVPEYDEAIERLLNTEWYPRPPAVAIFANFSEWIDEVREKLRRHRWETHVTDPATNGGFITSAHPLTWGNLDEIMSKRVGTEGMRIGTEDIGDPEIEVTFPVSRKVALIGYPMPEKHAALPLIKSSLTSIPVRFISPVAWCFMRTTTSSWDVAAQFGRGASSSRTRQTVGDVEFLSCDQAARRCLTTPVTASASQAAPV